MTKQKKEIVTSEHRGGGLFSLSEGLGPLVKKLLSGSHMIQAELFASWKSIVGETLATCTLPQKLTFKKGEHTDGVLHIAVRDGAYALELAHQKPTLIERINTYFGYKAVRDIRLSVNDTFFADISPLTIKDADKGEKTLVSSEQKKYIDQMTEGIQNSELKKHLQQLGESILKEEK